MEKIKKNMFKYLIPILSVVLIGAMFLLFYFWNNQEYKANVITELGSIFITLAFINILIEIKNKKDLEFKQITEIIKLNNLFMIYLLQYKGAYDRIFSQDVINYSDMSKLLKPSPSRINLSSEPAYIDFFRCWNSLFYQAESFLTKLDLGEENDLTELLEKFITNNMLIETFFTGLQNRGKLYPLNCDIEMLEKTTTSSMIREIPNLNDIYIVIFNLIQQNNIFIEEYTKVINKYVNKRKNNK